MTLQEKYAIENMRRKGYSSGTIASVLGVSRNTVKSFLRRNTNTCDERVCLNCGKPVKQHQGRKEKKFCSDKCRMVWWNSHQDCVAKQAFYTLICQHCGKPFLTKGKRKKKYCEDSCSAAEYQKRNREKLNAYIREWRETQKEGKED